MKAFLVGMSAFLIVDAAAWHGFYRVSLIYEAGNWWRYVASQSWSGVLTG